MKFKKISAVAAAMALASTMAISASAADWSKSGYADGDPSTVNIISTDENGATFTQSESGNSNCKLRITLSDILENPEDVSNIYSGEWDVTYNGLSSLNEENVGWLGGGTWAATCNSTQYSLSPTSWTEVPEGSDEESRAQWEDSQTVQDGFKWILPSQVPSDPTTAEFVFMDWSGQDLVAHGITVTVSNFHLYDKDGNEIAQKAYGSSDAAVEEEAADEETPEETEAPAEEEAAEEETVEETEAPAEEEAAAEEAPADEAPAEETEAPAAEEEAPAAEPAAPASDDTTTAAATGNASAIGIVGIMGVAAAAAAVSKKRK